MMAGMMGSGEMGGMMGMMMGGPSLLNSPNLVPNNAIQLTRSTNLIVVETEDGKALAAMDSRSDGAAEWARYEIPPGISVTPVVSEDLATFIARGDSVTEVAAFGTPAPRWIIQKLLHPVKEQISPAVAHGFVLFQEGQTFYAFSRSVGKWDALKLDGPEPASATINPTDVTVVQGNRLYVFPLGTARWTKEIVVKRASGTT